MTDSNTTAPDVAWAAYLIAGWWGSSLPAPSAVAEPEQVVRRLRKNGFPLLTLAADPRPAAVELLSSEAFSEALELDRRRMISQQAAFGEIVAGWRRQGIPALFVKAMGPAPTFPYVSNNLDVLVPQARQDEARAVVRGMDFVELRHIEEPNKFLFRRFHQGESAFDLHIHGRLEWHTEFVDSQAVWQRAVAAADGESLALVPAAEDALLIALAHAAYENKAYKLIELAKFIYAGRVLNVDWDRVAEGARRRGWLPGLWAILMSLDRWEQQLYGALGQAGRSLPAEVLARAEREMPARLKPAVAARFEGSVKAPVRIPFVESKRLFYEKMLADPSQSIAGRAKEVWTHTLYGTRVRLNLRSQRPHLVALEGIDGSGKSAQAALLATALEGAALRHRVVWTRGGSSSLLQPLLKLGKALIRQPAAPASDPHGTDNAGREQARAGLFRRPLVRRAWPWLIALELIPTYAVRIGWPLLRGEVVVADRYVLSALVEMAARLERPEIAATLPGKLLRLLSPRPLRAFWFDTPVEVALARKGGDESPEFLGRQVAASKPVLREMAAERVDAQQPMDIISDRLVTSVLREIEDRHWTVLNGLFCANPRNLKLAPTDTPDVAGVRPAGARRGTDGA